MLQKKQLLNAINGIKFVNLDELYTEYMQYNSLLIEILLIKVTYQ